MKEVDIGSLMGAITKDGEAKLSDHHVEDEADKGERELAEKDLKDELCTSN